MLLNRENDTINAMLYELEVNKLHKNVNQFKWSNFEMASKYLNNVMSGIHNFYYTAGHNVEDHVYIVFLFVLKTM